MTEPYRTPESIALIVKQEPRGLVRVNGRNCTCKPPGWLWCWWYEVRRGDLWYCDHGGKWERRYSGNIGDVWVGVCADGV